MDTIEITPHFENTAFWFATALRDNAFEGDTTEPIISLIEQVRHLTLTDVDAVQRIIDRLNRGGREGIRVPYVPAE